MPGPLARLATAAEARTDSHPPPLLVLALAAAQSGAAVPGALLGRVPGLTTSPDTLVRIAERLAWMPVFAGLLVLIARFARRFEAFALGLA
ncbi:hypothetical protein A8W25_08800 [Streptomyces sp. ERV7]|nr:hypothetical protein A8W25_08800 [Streptomyces sp. ERV7]